MATVAKAGNSQSVPTTTTTEVEAKPPKPPSECRWTCTLFLATVPANDAKSAPTTMTTEVEAMPPSPHNESRWACTLCRTTMSSNDVTTHKKGKRHMAAVAKAGNSQSAPMTTTTAEVEAKPPKPPRRSRWCTLCLTAMSPKDVTAHEKGKRHMAAVAKAGNSQCGHTTTTTTEVEAKPPKPTNESRWTCTLCLTTMSSNDATAHKKGKRHMAAVVKAGNSQSAPMTTTTAEVEAKPPKTPSRSRWCTLCLTAMSPKDVTAHEKGKRHMAAVAKAGNSQCGHTTTTTTEVEAKPPKPTNESRWTCTLCLTTMSSNDATAHKKGKRHMAAVVKAGNLQSVPTARPSLQHNSPKPEPGARPTAPDIEKTKSLAPVKSPAKVKKKETKGNTPANSKKSTKGTVPPSFSADGYDWQGQSDWECSDSSNYLSTCNTHINSCNLDWSIRDEDGGWYGNCMNGVSIEYVLPYLYFIFFCCCFI